MKLIKMLQIVIVVSVLSILTGCSEEILSPSGMNNKSNEITDPASSDAFDPNVYHSVIRLKPQRDYSFDFSNTGFYSFNSISIYPETSRRLFEIIGYMDDEVIMLDNNSSGFFVRSITIKNLTSRFIDLTVVLKGSKIPVRDPHPGISNNEE